MLEFEEYKVKLNGIRPDLDGLGAALKLDEARAEIAELEAESAKEGFWNDLDRSQKVQKRIKQLQQKCEKYEKLQSSWDDLMTICEMALEENDDSMLAELETDYAKLESELEAMRLSTLLSGEYDANNVILSIHPGAGGRPRTGRRCFIECTPAGQSATATRIRSWTGRTARKRE